MSYNVVNKRGKTSQIRATSSAVITINDLTYKELQPGTASSNLSIQTVIGGGSAFDPSMNGLFLWNNANVFIGRVNNVVNSTFLVLTSPAEVTSNTPFYVGPEAVLNFSIAKIFWSTANTITISRTNLNTGDLQLRGTDNWQLDTFGFQLSEGSTSNLVITIPDTSSTCLIEVHKNVRSGQSQYLGAER